MIFLVGIEKLSTFFDTVNALKMDHSKKQVKMIEVKLNLFLERLCLEKNWDFLSMK